MHRAYNRCRDEDLPCGSIPSDTLCAHRLGLPARTYGLRFNRCACVLGSSPTDPPPLRVTVTMKSTLIAVFTLAFLGCNVHPQTDYRLRGLPIAKHAIPAGTVIREEDIDFLALPDSELDAPELPHRMSQIVGHKALENIPATGSIPLARVSP